MTTKRRPTIGPRGTVLPGLGVPALPARRFWSGRSWRCSPSVPGSACPRPDQAGKYQTRLSIAAGETLYDLHCSACHGIGGVGAKGPPLLGVGPAAVDFFLSTGRMPLSSPNHEPLPGPAVLQRRPRSPRSSLTSTTSTTSTAPLARGSPR